jgi:hypothetical protein
LSVVPKKNQRVSLNTVANFTILNRENMILPQPESRTGEEKKGAEKYIAFSSCLVKLLIITLRCGFLADYLTPPLAIITSPVLLCGSYTGAALPHSV